MADEECVFCTNACQRMDTYESLGAERFPSYLFARLPGFRILGDNAPLTPGHLLVVPDRHTRSAALLPTTELHVADRVVDALMAGLSEAGNGAIAFEHGTGACHTESACCLVHSHIHVVAADTDVHDWFAQRQVREIGRVDDLTDLAQAGSHEYLFARRHGHPGTMWHGAGLPSQLLRRLIGEDLGVALWNWHDRLMLQSPPDRIAETLTNRQAAQIAIDRARAAVSGGSGDRVLASQV